ncbi:MAG TPA: dihydrofolate synthase [Bacteroidales bacterium]|nr:dihydrofolate synthase [Bacteroidales bacterium]
MTYEQAVHYLYTSQPAFHLLGASAYKPGLENTCRLMAHLSNPHLLFPAVHIAGTNGKGSTSHLIAAALQSSAYKVGLYTSPHLVDFRERIRISGEMIPEQEVIRFVENNQSFLEELKPSFFETTMALAFSYFAEQQVDIAVIEVGLGGRLDSTNIITPILSVITNIGKDHTEFLGNTLSSIATEKAGIIKEHIPVVIGETNKETAPVFLHKAAETHSMIVFADQLPHRIIPCELTGCYQEKNIQTAQVALNLLSQTSPFRVSEDAITNGFARVCRLTGLRGRWETLSHTKPTIICDTGHNAHGIRYVASQLKSLLDKYHRLHIVFGMVNDKDVQDAMALLPSEAVFYFTQARTHRAVPAVEMKHIGESLSLCGEAYSSVTEAVKAAVNAASENDLIFIGGSNYVVGEALQLAYD